MRSLEAGMLEYALNSIWQAPLVFLAAWMMVRTVRQAGPAVEHRIWVGALVLQTVLPAVSLAPLSLTPGYLLRGIWALVRLSFLGSAAAGEARITVVPGAGYVHGVLGVPAPLLAGAAVLYGCSVAYFAARLVCSLWRTGAMRRRAARMVPTGSTARIWNCYERKFQIPCVGLALSHEICGPMTMGVRRKLVLLPAGFQASLSDEDLEAAIAHEFAHIRRGDFAKNLLYELLSLPVAYHPVLRLTRARVAQSREMVCDAMAAQAIAGPESYARSLLRLASLVVRDRDAWKLHAIGISDANNFERRVMSLTKKHRQLQGARRLTIGALWLAIGFATCASAMALRLQVPTLETQSGSGAASASNTSAQVPRVGVGVMAGNLLTHVNPVYPPDAKASGIQGSVVLHAIIGKDGAVRDLQVVSGPKELRQSALDAVQQWTYKPYLLNGNPTEVETTLTVNFRLNR